MLMCIDYLKITMLYRLHIQGFLCFGLFYMENNQTIVAVHFTPFNHSFYDFLAPYLGSLQRVQLRLSARCLRASWHHKCYIMIPACWWIWLESNQLPVMDLCPALPSATYPYECLSLQTVTEIFTRRFSQRRSLIQHSGGFLFLCEVAPLFRGSRALPLLFRD